ncbi:MAG: hypothetical protein LC656_05715 [Sphingomonadales bacterium]|nr:hypothetical protein [Sphingomonadales bacterium]
MTKETLPALADNGEHLPVLADTADPVMESAIDLLAPASLNGVLLGKLLSPDDADKGLCMLGALETKITAVNAGDISELEGMLTAQAHVLNGLFVNNLIQAQANLSAFPNAHERFSRLALKAQAQCRVTIEAIAEIKNPTVFARHTNIVSGHQQVNIGGDNARGRKRVSAEQPQAALTDGGCATVPGANSLGQALPVPGDAERKVPNARRPVARRAEG